VARHDRHNRGARYGDTGRAAIEADRMNGEAAGLLWCTWRETDNHTFGTTTLRVLNGRATFGARGDVLASGTIVVAISELEILVFFSGDLQVVHGEAVVGA